MPLNNFFQSGDVYSSTGTNGCIFLYSPNMISIDGLCLNLADIKTVSIGGLNKKSPIYYQGVIIGKLHSLNFDQRRQGLVGYFTLHPNRSDLNFDKITAIADTTQKTIGCLSCQSRYVSGDSPCPCIRQSSAVSGTKNIITSVTFYEKIQQNTMTKKLVEQKLDRFFTGSVATIVMLEEEYDHSNK